MYTLYILSNGLNPRKVLAFIDHLGIDKSLFDVVDVPYPLLKSPQFKKLNPTGTAPVLCNQDGNVISTESEAIMDYLWKKHAPESPLLSLDSDTALEISNWRHFATQDVNPARLRAVADAYLIHPKLREVGLLKQSPEEIEAGIANANKQMEILKPYFEKLNAHLAQDRQFFVGNDWTAADYSVLSPAPYILAMYVEKKIDMSDYPNLMGAYSRMELQNQHWKNTAQNMLRHNGFSVRQFSSDTTQRAKPKGITGPG